MYEPDSTEPPTKLMKCSMGLAAHRKTMVIAQL